MTQVLSYPMLHRMYCCRLLVQIPFPSPNRTGPAISRPLSLATDRWPPARQDIADASPQVRVKLLMHDPVRLVVVNDEPLKHVR